MYTLVNWAVLEWQFISCRAVKSDSVHLGSNVFQTQYFRKITTIIQLFLQIKLKREKKKKEGGVAYRKNLVAFLLGYVRML